MPTACRVELEPYNGERVRVEGWFEKTNPVHGKLTSLVQDAHFADPASGEKIAIGHIWVQASNAIKNANPAHGSRIEFTALVRPYRKYFDTPNADGVKSVTCWGLEFPNDVLVDEPEQPVSPTDAARPNVAVTGGRTPTNGLERMRRLKELATKVPDLRSVLPHLPEIVAVTAEFETEDIGGYLELIGSN